MPFRIWHIWALSAGRHTDKVTHIRANKIGTIPAMFLEIMHFNSRNEMIDFLSCSPFGINDDTGHAIIISIDNIIKWSNWNAGIANTHSYCRCAIPWKMPCLYIIRFVQMYHKRIPCKQNTRELRCLFHYNNADAHNTQTHSNNYFVSIL